MEYFERFSNANSESSFEQVVYSNYMSQLYLGDLTKAELDIFMAICAKVKNKDTQQVVLAIPELRNLVKDTTGSNRTFAEYLYTLNKKLIKMSGEYKTGDGCIVVFNIFSTFIIDTRADILRVSVNPDYTFLLNNLTRDFTKFELEEFVNLRSKFSKNLYRMLRQYRGTQMYVASVDKLRFDLGAGNNYTDKMLAYRVVAESVKECENYFPNLVCTKIKSGRKTAAFKFTWGDQVVSEEDIQKEQEKKNKANTNSDILSLDELEIIE